MNIDLEHNLRHSDCISKYVKIITVNKREYEGWLKCIDPKSGNLFLITFDDDFEKVVDVVLIMGDGYTSLEVIRDSDPKIKDIQKALYAAVPNTLCEDITERKKRLIAWIQKNRLPFEEHEDGSILVCETVTICLPYEVQNCSSLNTTVLKNIRRLVANLPPAEANESDA